MAYEGSPAWLGGDLVAPLLIFHGQDWQKKEFLPKVARAEIDFAQGFSEPNAGSDLANLQTRAVRDGDDYVINGQKIWTSAAHYGEWYHVLVRTDPNAPKHRGISYLLMQLRDDSGNLTAGITLRPLYDMTGTRRWSEVFFDNVRVPVRNLIGEENRGWYAAMTTLSFERSGIEIPARLQGQLERFVQYCRETPIEGVPVLDSPVVKNKLADLRVEIEARRMLSYRVVSMQAAGLVPVKEASMAKAWGQELNKKFPVVLTRILSEYASSGQGTPGRLSAACCPTSTSLSRPKAWAAAQRRSSGISSPSVAWASSAKFNALSQWERALRGRLRDLRASLIPAAVGTGHRLPPVRRMLYLSDAACSSASARAWAKRSVPLNRARTGRRDRCNSLP